MKKKTLLMSILTIVMCLSLTIGGTFALFTSESELNIAVNSGKVAISATIDQGSVATKELYDTDYTAGDNNMYEGEATFTTEGLTLEKFVPGDGIKFNIVVRNDSNVTVKYRTVIECKEDNGLFSGLIVNIGDKQNYDGVRYIAIWETLSEYSADIIIPVSIELPENAGNEYQGKKCIINYFVEAVQGNAETFNEVYAEEEITVDPTTNTTTQGVNIGAGSASATIGAGAKADDNADSFALSITNADPNTGSFAFDGGEGKLGLDIKIAGLSQDNTVPVTITLQGYIEAGLTGVAMFHKGVAMTSVDSKDYVDEHNEFNYDPATGDITLATKNFSNFTIVTNSVDFAVPSADISVFDEADLPTKENDMMIFNGAFGGIEFPSIREDVALEKAFKFLAKQTAEEAASSQYAGWIADFVIECDQDVALGELGLSGQYQEAFGDTWFTFGNPIELKAGQKLPMISSFGFFFSYLDICELVKEFNCGIFRGQDAKSMAGKTITVSLCIANADAVEDPYDLSSYSEENGTLKTLSSISYTFEVIPEGKVNNAYTSETSFWGEWGGNARESFEIKIYSGETYLGSTSLNNVGGIIDGDVNVTWHLSLDVDSDNDEYWTQKWEQRPTMDLLPTRAVLYVDGVNVGESPIQYNGPDDLFKPEVAICDENGAIVRFFSDFMEGWNWAIANGYTNIEVLSDVEIDSPIVNPAA